ncbi:FtsX-like permease family protein [Curtobacterium aetherium]|uniref:FtsX-like permease family protein n=1 Tax=Curtobacterium aetherium TaxID=2841594 RepID=A0ACD1E2K3_9MICO|nr:FtsX-like permease family protein [Curtobacterium sp. L6-1]QWS33170.1 FtsX-like permease family protein [Curtobacterium sp. L6-1]
MRAALRSLLVVNRAAVIGAGVVVALAAVLLAVTAAWLEAGVRHPEAPFLSTVAGSFAGTLLLITVFMVASVFAGVLRERRREFALLRAIGATAGQIRGTVRTEVLVLLALVAPVGALVGTVVAPLVTPLLRSSAVVPATFSLAPSAIPLLSTLVVLVPTGLLAAAMAARAATRPSPTDAVRASTTDVPTLSRGRQIAAAVTALTGLATATTPFFTPGLVGSATGATSAIVLVVAAALAGPLLVQWGARRALTGRHGTASTLALLNARGASRRLSAAVVPLALLVALGTVQTGTDAAVQRATEDQLRAGLQADLVVTAGDGVTGAQAERIAALPGVRGTTTVRDTAGSVQVEQADEDLGGLEWEPTAVCALSADTAALDPAVRSGSLDALSGPGTVAVSSDLLALTPTGLGDTIRLRTGDGPAESARIVAVYDRGLAFGDVLVRDRASGPVDTLLVDTASGDRAAVREALRATGADVATVDGYVATALRAGSGDRQLSLVLVVALLAFVAAAAANTLLTTTRGRRDEFALLQRTGATRAQLLRMAGVETAYTAVAAVVIGTVAVVPALVGVGYGLTGSAAAGFDLVSWAGFAAAAVLVAVVGVQPAAGRIARGR